MAVRCAYYARRPRLAIFDAHRAIESQTVRDRLADVAAGVLRLLAGQLPRTVGWEPIEPAGASCLRRDGLVPLPPLLDDAQIDETVQWLASRACHAPYHAGSGTFLAEHAPPEVHLANYDDESIMRAPHLLALANDPHILSMVEDFLGAKPTISNLSLWWSFPRANEAIEAQLFHRDVDDLRFCKLFVYLTDVDLDSGPHVFVHGSPISSACRRIRRYRDDEIEAEFGSAAIECLCGKRGTSFVANTSGIHKGLPPLRTRRLLFQVQYSLFPLFSSKYHPVSLQTTLELDRYVNRLYVS